MIASPACLSDVLGNGAASGISLETVDIVPTVMHAEFCGVASSPRPQHKELNVFPAPTPAVFRDSPAPDVQFTSHAVSEGSPASVAHSMPAAVQFPVCGHLTKAEEQMISFTTSAMQDSPLFDASYSMDADLSNAVAWNVARPDEKLKAEQEHIMHWIEERVASCKLQRHDVEWFRNCCPIVQKVSEGVCGPVLQELCDMIGHSDRAAPDLFRYGGPLIGKLPCTGNGKEHIFPAPTDVSDMWNSRATDNAALHNKLREDKHSKFLMDQCKADAMLCRMSEPHLLEPEDVSGTRISPGFCVEQGLKEDGSLKLRAIYDLSRSGVNACTEAVEKLSYDSIDALFAVSRSFMQQGRPIAFLKADIDAAYRRVPIDPRHRWAAGVMFKYNGATQSSCHYSFPFGAKAAVHAWDRIGALLTNIARKILHLPMLRFVDDFFTAAPEECAEHAMNIFARLVRSLLGCTAISQTKLEFGLPLPILGLSVTVDAAGMSCIPLAKKIHKWLSIIDETLATRKMTPAAAGKLAGALCWAATHMFHRLGRAMLRAFFTHSKGLRSNFGALSPMSLSLKWWREVLSMNLSQHRPWEPSLLPVVQLFCDARGQPARLAAVLFIDGRRFFCDMEPAAETLAFFSKRRDNQICGLELLSIALGLSTFDKMIKGRKLHIFSDNKGAEASTRKGASRQFDHTCIVHCLWSKAAQLGIEMVIDRVPSKDNLADLPSREEYSLMHKIGAQNVEARMHPDFCSPTAWEALKLPSNFC